MRYLQRPSTDDTTVRPGAAQDLWRPRQLPTPDAKELAELTPPPLASDRYVTVDERVEGVVGLVIAHWPEVTAQGRLRFPRTPTMAWFGEERLQEALDGYRARAKQLARPLRIGDTFWVRDWQSRSLDWGNVIDITQAARQAAKVAVAAAIGDYRVRPTGEQRRARPVPTPAPASTPPPRSAGPDAVAQPII